MGNLASDIDNAQFAGAVPDTTGLGVRFYKEARQNAWRSRNEGRPIFEDVVMVHIVLPGNNLFDVKEVVQERHRQRFPLQWASFQNAQGDDPMMIGTPITQWPQLGLSQVEELKALRFYTVESIAEASDATLQRVGMAAGMAPTALRERAQRFLQVAKGDSAATAQAEEIKKLRDEQAAKDSAHAEQMAGLQAQLAALTAAIQVKPARPRGRPRKATTGA